MLDPISIVPNAAVNPTSSEMRAPCTIRSNTERPKLSVPSGYSSVGGVSSSDGGASSGPSAVAGSIDAGSMNTGPTIATTTKNVSTATPTMPWRSRRNVAQWAAAVARRRCHTNARGDRSSRACSADMSGLAHPGVEIAIRDVGGEVERDHGGAGQEEDPLDHRVVELVDRLVGQQTETRPREDRLDDDRAAEHEAEVEEDQRERRQERVRHHVVTPDHVLGQALRPGTRDVVLVRHVDHRRSHDDRVLADVAQREREHRQ